MQKNKFARKKIAELMVDIREERILKSARKNDKNLYFKIFLAVFWKYSCLFWTYTVLLVEFKSMKNRKLWQLR